MVILSLYNKEHTKRLPHLRLIAPPPTVVPLLYINRVQDPSLLQLLVDLRGEETDCPPPMVVPPLYNNRVQDPSLLRFLVDLRGEETTNKQLRDDLMTMLVAGHETTAAVLTWAAYLLATHPEIMEQVQAEVDQVRADSDTVTIQ
eukprot:1164002-Prorocentrum_minimum.AAC.1